MTGLADAVLPLIRTRTDLHRWSAANAHGRQMHVALDILDDARPTADPADFYSVTHRALASAVKIIMRADDSSGIIGDACRRLLALHPQAAAQARTPAKRLVDWMISFQFDGDVDFFELDPVAYGPALGEAGMAAYREQLALIRSQLGPAPIETERWTAPDAHARFTLARTDRRLAVFDRDVDAIVSTHAGEHAIAANFQAIAEAFIEIGDHERAIHWARRAIDVPPGHQALRAGQLWCTLLEQHHPAEVLPARVELFRRWPSSSTAATLYAAAGPDWPSHAETVVAALQGRPRDLVLFTMSTLHDVELAWRRAHELSLADADVWLILIDAYEPIDPLATLPVLERLVVGGLVEADAQAYRTAAQRLARMRRLAAGTDRADDVDLLIAGLRETHRRRPRLQQEFSKAGLP